MHWQGRETESGVEEWIQRHRLGFERTLLALLYVGTSLVVIGSLSAIVATFLTIWAPVLLFKIGTWVAVAGVALLATSIVMGSQIKRVRRVGAGDYGGSMYERRRLWNRIKTSGILLNLLSILATVILLVAMFPVVGLDPVDLPGFLAIERITLSLSLVLAGTLAFCLAHALRTSREREVHSLDTAFFLLGAGGAVVFSALAAWVVNGPTHIPLIGDLLPGHASLFVLAGTASTSLAAFITRRLPSLTAIFLDEREFRQTGAYVSRQKSVIMPTMIAFALLFLVVLLLFVFELSVVSSFEAIPKNALLLGLFGFILFALVASVAVSFSLSRSDDDTSLYQQIRSTQQKKTIMILGVSAVLTTILLAFTFMIFIGKGPIASEIPSHRWVDFFAFSLLAALGPYGFYYAKESKRIKALEARFPDFLRDLAASRKAGLTLESAVKIAAEGEYGALTPDIQKMADQLSWNVPFDEALQRFSERVDTPLVHRACTLIIEAGRSGGQVTDVLEAAATDARELKTLENERSLTMGLYTAVIYIAFLVFLGVAAVLYGTFIPEVLGSAQAAAGSSASSAAAGNPFAGNGGVGLMQFRTFFFLAAMVQGVGNGILAGIMQSGEPLNGLRHAFVMVVISYLAFGLVL